MVTRAHGRSLGEGAPATLAPYSLGLHLLILRRGEGAPEILRSASGHFEHLAILQMSEHLVLSRCDPPDGSEMFFL